MDMPISAPHHAGVWRRKFELSVARLPNRLSLDPALKFYGLASLHALLVERLWRHRVSMSRSFKEGNNLCINRCGVRLRSAVGCRGYNIFLGARDCGRQRIGVSASDHV